VEIFEQAKEKPKQEVNHKI